MLGLGLDSWNNLMTAFLGIGALAGVIVGVSQFVVIRIQKMESDASAAAFEKYKLGVSYKLKMRKKRESRPARQPVMQFSEPLS
jgi:hypothetical protein